MKSKCTRMNGRTCGYDGSFEDWLHGCHHFVVKCGLMLPFVYKTYPGLGKKDDPKTVIIEPCFQEGDLRLWLTSKGLLDERVEHAIALAKEVHWNQLRDDGSPYLEQHIYPVVGMMLWIYSLRGKLWKEYINYFPDPADRANVATPRRSRDMVIVALLHDILEDSDIDERELKYTFGERIYEMVKILTKKRPGVDKYSISEYMQRVCAAPRQVRIVKLADRLNNVFCLQYTDEEKRKRYLEETARWYMPLAKKTSAYFHLWYYRTLKSLDAI